MSTPRVLLLGACVALASAIATTGRAADAPREVHGSADAFAAPGLALAWGVLRGASEGATVVVLRIIGDPAAYPFLAAVGINPFSQRRQAMLPATPVAGTIDVRLPRAHFAEFPRTELRFYESAVTLQADAPQLIVFYLGVPDTTPEFTTPAALDTDITNRIARVRETVGVPK